MDARPFGNAIHASAVAAGGRGLLILGPSRSGKSRLALALIAASTKQHPIRLVGDDRILLTRRGGALIARPHPRIEGFIERRGSGILAIPFVHAAIVDGVVDLGCTTPSLPTGQNLRCLRHVKTYMSGLTDIEAVAMGVLDWWRGASTTPGAKPSAAVACVSKD